MQKDISGTILKEYDKQFNTYSIFTEKIRGLIKELLDERGFRYHSVTSRPKSLSNLQEKLNRIKDRYSKLSDITDLSGVRIITYYPDDVDSVAKLIEKEFDIDIENSEDKRKLLDPDRFGYLSLHYVAKLSSSRLSLSEYRRFKDFKVEIQIRSILQHAWAEIEHDLGYKGKQAIPKEIRRRFSRLAGLLEIADIEFSAIRDSLKEYKKVVSHQIDVSPGSVAINQASLYEFAKRNRLIRILDKQIAKTAKAQLVEDETFFGRIVDNLHYVGMKNIGDIECSLRKSHNDVVSFAESIIGKQKQLLVGICLWYLCYFLMAQRGSTEKIVDYLEKYLIGTIEERSSFAGKIINIYNKMIKKCEKRCKS